jgi:hypothetical protein
LIGTPLAAIASLSAGRLLQPHALFHPRVVIKIAVKDSGASLDLEARKELVDAGDLTVSRSYVVTANTTIVSKPRQDDIPKRAKWFRSGWNRWPSLQPSLNKSVMSAEKAVWTSPSIWHGNTNA